jgi:CheY-like chemotaxis protein
MAPGIDGYEVLKQLRRTPGHATTPVIVATGVATGDWAIQLGANLFLRMPIDMTALVNAIHELLSAEAR